MVRELLWRPGAVLGESFEGLVSVWGYLCGLMSRQKKRITLSLPGLVSYRPLAKRTPPFPTRGLPSRGESSLADLRESPC